MSCSRRPTWSSTRLEIAGEVEANWDALERAHGYQSLIRTELARNPGVAEQWICGPDLLARCPDLLAVCSAGAGYDIIDVDACTAAGVIVCNNSGPGREAVAEHALGFMLALAKKIVVADRMIRREIVQDRMPRCAAPSCSARRSGSSVSARSVAGSSSCARRSR